MPVSISSMAVLLAEASTTYRPGGGHCNVGARNCHEGRSGPDARQDEVDHVGAALGDLLLRHQVAVEDHREGEDVGEIEEGHAGDRDPQLRRIDAAAED